MGLGSAVRRSGIGGTRGVAVVCALALAVTLAQPLASWAWVSGAHVTVEQILLHEEAVAHGYTDHHGGHHASSEALGPVFVPGHDHAGLYQDVLNGALVRRPDLLSRDGGYRLDPRDVLSRAQNVPPVPHRPPITP